ncbi:MAG: polymer-forming cytoskeletal protein [Myxococcota bacterium]|nr:polymer-forming cytoskeletal protein [Myxococcota bacterium]
MAKSPTIITASTGIKGRIKGDEDVELYGRIEGHVELGGHLYVDEGARLDADINAHEVTVHGIIVGDTVAATLIKLEPTARVVGDLSAPRIIIEEGALVRGLVETTDSPTTGQRRTAKPERAARTAVAPPSKQLGEDDDSEDDGEPEPPKSAKKKKVAVKKRK